MVHSASDHNKVSKTLTRRTRRPPEDTEKKDFGALRALVRPNTARSAMLSFSVSSGGLRVLRVTALLTCLLRLERDGAWAQAAPHRHPRAAPHRHPRARPEDHNQHASR